MQSLGGERNKDDESTSLPIGAERNIPLINEHVEESMSGAQMKQYNNRESKAVLTGDGGEEGGITAQIKRTSHRIGSNEKEIGERRQGVG